VIELDVRARSSGAVERERGAHWQEGALLAAAVAAALVEYRDYVRQEEEPGGAAGVGTNWRAIACWERLRGGR
jgi:hypothetical protein